MFEKKGKKKTRDLTLSSSLSFWFANDGLVGLSLVCAIYLVLVIIVLMTLMIIIRI